MFVKSGFDRRFLFPQWFFSQQQKTTGSSRSETQCQVCSAKSFEVESWKVDNFRIKGLSLHFYSNVKGKHMFSFSESCLVGVQSVFSSLIKARILCADQEEEASKKIVYVVKLDSCVQCLLLIQAHDVQHRNAAVCCCCSSSI